MRGDRVPAAPGKSRAALQLRRGRLRPVLPLGCLQKRCPTAPLARETPKALLQPLQGQCPTATGEVMGYLHLPPWGGVAWVRDKP